MIIDLSSKRKLARLLAQYPGQRRLNPLKIDLPDPLHEGEEVEEEPTEELEGEEYLRALEKERLKAVLEKGRASFQERKEKAKAVREKKEKAPSTKEISMEVRGPRGPYKESGEMICTSPQLFVKLLEFVHDSKPDDVKLHRMAEGMTQRGRKGWDMKQYEDIIRMNPRMNPEIRGKYFHLPVLNSQYFEPRYATLGPEKFHHVSSEDLAHAREALRRRTGLSKFPKGMKIVVGSLRDRAPLFKHTMGPRGPRRWAIQKLLIPVGRRRNPMDLMMVGANPDGRKIVSDKYRMFHKTNPKYVEQLTIDGLKKPDMRLVRIGHCIDMEVTRNGTPHLVQFPGGKPHIYFNDKGKMLIISKEKIGQNNIMKVVRGEVSKGAGKVHAVSYKAPEHSSKQGTPYRHEFGAPKPSWYASKDGGVIIIKGGRFYVKDWIYK